MKTVNGFSQILLKDYSDKLDDHGKDYLGFVRACTLRMNQLIEDLLSFSRITRKDLNQETVNLSSLAARVVQELQKGQPECKVEFVVGDRPL